MKMTPNTFAHLAMFLAGTIFGGLIAFFTWGMLSPGDPSKAFLPDFLPYQDKVLHFVAFAMMAVPACLVLPRRFSAFVFVSMVALAAGMEVAQSVSNLGRESSFTDFAASAIGGGTGIIATHILKSALLNLLGSQTRQLFQ